MAADRRGNGLTTTLQEIRRCLPQKVGSAVSIATSPVVRQRCPPRSETAPVGERIPDLSGPRALSRIGIRTLPEHAQSGPVGDCRAGKAKEPPLGRLFCESFRIGFCRRQDFQVSPCIKWRPQEGWSPILALLPSRLLVNRVPEGPELNRHYPSPLSPGPRGVAPTPSPTTVVARVGIGSYLTVRIRLR